MLKNRACYSNFEYCVKLKILYSIKQRLVVIRFEFLGGLEKRCLFLLHISLKKKNSNNSSDRCKVSPCWRKEKMNALNLCSMPKPIQTTVYWLLQGNENVLCGVLLIMFTFVFRLRIFLVCLFACTAWQGVEHMLDKELSTCLTRSWATANKENISITLFFESASTVNSSQCVIAVHHHNRNARVACSFVFTRPISN